MSDHTSTPWEINPVRTVENMVMITGGTGFDFGLVAEVTEEPDAVFIVKVANNHDALVSALEDARSFMVEMRARHGDSGVGILIRAADEALSLVSGQ